MTCPNRQGGSDAATRLAWGFRVNNSGTKAAGDGNLLRRSHGSRMCLDCHNLKTHSSQTTSSDHGNWAISCVACHTPHLTRNIYLIRESITTPNSGERPVRFETKPGAVADSSTQGTASYVNEDNATRIDGICQACHTRTSDTSGTVARWRNADSGGNADSHYGATATSQCTGCHTHEATASAAGAGGTDRRRRDDRIRRGGVGRREQRTRIKAFSGDWRELVLDATKVAKG